eukprot:403352125
MFNLKFIILLPLILVFTLATAEDHNEQEVGMRELEPYCGAKTKDIRFCRYLNDCEYSDEYCSDEGVCVVDEQLYIDDPCKTQDGDIINGNSNGN